MTESGGNTVIPSLQRRSMTESGGCAVRVGKKLKCANPRKGRGGKREDAGRRRGGCHGGGETRAGSTNFERERNWAVDGEWNGTVCGRRAPKLKHKSYTARCTCCFRVT